MEAAQREAIRAAISEHQLRCMATDAEILREAKEGRREARKHAERVVRRCKRKGLTVPESIATQLAE